MAPRRTRGERSRTACVAGGQVQITRKKRTLFVEERGARCSPVGFTSRLFFYETHAGWLLLFQNFCSGDARTEHAGLLIRRLTQIFAD